MYICTYVDMPHLRKLNVTEYMRTYFYLSGLCVLRSYVGILVLLLFSVYIYHIRRHIELITQTYLCTWIPQGIFLILFLLIVFYLRMYVSILKTDITFTSYCTYVRIPHSSQFHNFHDPWSMICEGRRWETARALEIGLTTTAWTHSS